LSPLDNLLNFIKSKIKNKEIYEKLDNSKFDSLIFKSCFSQMIIDSFARIISDDKNSIVTSAQFFQNRDDKNVIEIINISGNYVDSNLINRTVTIIKNAQQVQSNPLQFKHPNNFIFNNLSIEKLKYLNNIISMLLECIERITHETPSIQEYDNIIENLKSNDEKIKKNLMSNKINEQLIIDRLNLFLEFVHYVLYAKFDQFIFSISREPTNKDRFIWLFLVFLQFVWDKYSFIVLSKDFYQLENLKVAYNNEQFEIPKDDNKKINYVLRECDQTHNLQLVCIF
jgi:hypothetical protein